MIEKKTVAYKHYGKCLEITNGNIKMLVTTDVGPRIIYFGFIDGDNIMFEDIEDKITNSGEYFDQNFAPGTKWHIYGGHRLWKSPEDLATYAPDNAPVTVEETANGAVLIAPPEKMTGLTKSISIAMHEDGKVEVVHRFTNHTGQPVSASLWGLSVLDKGGVGYVPLSQEDTGYLANRNLVLWSYTDIHDPRLEIKQDAIVLHQNEHAETNLKIGTLSPLGEAYYQIRGKLFKKTFVTDIQKTFADFSCNIECYTSNLMMEIETLSDFSEIEPGGIKELAETWQLFDKNADEYKRVDQILHG